MHECTAHTERPAWCSEYSTRCRTVPPCIASGPLARRGRDAQRALRRVEVSSRSLTNPTRGRRGRAAICCDLLQVLPATIASAWCDVQSARTVRSTCRGAGPRADAGSGVGVWVGEFLIEVDASSGAAIPRTGPRPRDRPETATDRQRHPAAESELDLLTTRHAKGQATRAIRCEAPDARAWCNKLSSLPPLHTPSRGLLHRGPLAGPRPVLPAAPGREGRPNADE
jgi:hypothetical protein